MEASIQYRPKSLVMVSFRVVPNWLNRGHSKASLWWDCGAMSRYVDVQHNSGTGSTPDLGNQM